jgi:hypothetical protein
MFEKLIPKQIINYPKIIKIENIMVIFEFPTKNQK